jgi:CO/xanthine dehydrogenase Mo-binding subunit
MIDDSRHHTLIGKNYTTPDLVAKVTGAAKYAEDFRVEGMLYARLLLSPVPHGRVTRLDLSAALAMPGVKAILTEADLPAPASSVTDSGVTLQANLKGERALTMEPLYAGEPILAVAAVDELTAAEAIEKIVIEFEHLPFTVDPLDALRPGSANPRLDGNMWERPAPPPRPAPGAPPPPPPGPPGITELKWTEADFAEVSHGRLPMGDTPAADRWSYGELEKGFESAALVLDETFVTSNVSHQTLESRTALAYWRNGKVYVHTGTQSTSQTVAAIARWLGVDAVDVVLISDYTGGGFGSKVTAGISLMIPALLSRKTKAPVMMRVSRQEEHGIGGARPAFHGRVKIGFAENGRITAIDMFALADNGPYEWQFDSIMSGRIVSLLYQPPAMRFRCVSVLTNTPTRRSLSQPGGMQGITLVGPVLAKAARRLGIDEVAIHRINAPEGKAPFGPILRTGARAYSTSSFVKEAIDKGAAQFEWESRRSRSGLRRGAKVRGVGMATSAYISGSVGFDGLLVIRPNGRVSIHSGIGNLGTHSVIDVNRVAAEVLDVPWEQCDVVWGDSSKHLPWTCITGGSQTTHAMTRASHAVGTRAKAMLQDIAARALGGSSGAYQVSNGRVFSGSRSMTFAQAAQKAIELGGKYDGHEPPQDVNAFTRRSVTALAGQGLVVAARDTYPHDGQTHSFVASFAEVEVDLETGKYDILAFLAVADVGTVINPRSLGGQVLGRSMLGIAHAIGQKWVFDQHYGVPLATRFYQNKPPTILDAPQQMRWDAVNLPDPETPVGARGIGEPPVAAGCCAIINALAAAVGDKVFTRVPVNLDTILTSLEAGRPMQDPFTANI